MGSSRDDIGKSIKNAIKAGRAQYDEKQKEIERKNATERDKQFKWRERERAAAKVWVKDVLPTKIKEQVAAGRNSLDVSEDVAEICEGVSGIRVERYFVRGERGEEGMYATDDHWEYTIYW